MSWHASIADSKTQFTCALSILHKKSGSRSSLKEFRRAIRHLVHHDHLPDYYVVFDEKRYR